MQPPDSLRDRVLAAAAATPSAGRVQTRRTAAIGYLSASAAMLGVFAWAGGIDHAAGRPLEYTLAIASGAAVIAAIVGLWAFGRGNSMVGRPPRVLIAVAAAAPVAVFLWLVAWHPHYVDPSVRVGYRCLGLTLALAAGLLSVSLYLRRHSVALAPQAHGAALGAASGAIAGVLVDLWCPLTEPAHVLVGHVLPIVLLAGVAAVVGGNLLRVRAQIS